MLMGRLFQVCQLFEPEILLKFHVFEPQLLRSLNKYFTHEHANLITQLFLLQPNVDYTE